MPKRNNPEHDMQVSVFEWIRGEGQLVYPELVLCHSSTTGQPKYGWEIDWYKDEGAEGGYPDVNFPIPRCGYHGLYIELKMPGKKVREDQAFRIWCLRRFGYAAVVRYTRNDIIMTLEDYILNKGVYEPNHILEYIPWKPKKKKGKNANRNQNPPYYRSTQLYQHWQLCLRQDNI